MRIARGVWPVRCKLGSRVLDTGCGPAQPGPRQPCQRPVVPPPRGGPDRPFSLAASSARIDSAVSGGGCGCLARSVNSSIARGATTTQPVCRSPSTSGVQPRQPRSLRPVGVRRHNAMRSTTTEAPERLPKPPRHDVCGARPSHQSTPLRWIAEWSV